MVLCQHIYNKMTNNTTTSISAVKTYFRIPSAYVINLRGDTKGQIIIMTVILRANHYNLGFYNVQAQSMNMKTNYHITIEVPLLVIVLT